MSPAIYLANAVYSQSMARKARGGRGSASARAHAHHHGRAAAGAARVGPLRRGAGLGCALPNHAHHRSTSSSSSRAARPRGVARAGAEDEPSTSEEGVNMSGFEDIADAWEQDSDAAFLLKLLVLSVGGAYLVKYGSLLVDFPFEPSVGLALAIIFIPTGLNVLKWWRRSQGKDDSWNP
mmetsp:Transcript_45106/g.143655  ORF Transcript_45106/g.143655 Transcript_45106/m.143655 type:complete len:179 (-) Transcript_45106:1230-1766(-)